MGQSQIDLGVMDNGCWYLLKDPEVPVVFTESASFGCYQEIILEWAGFKDTGLSEKTGKVIWEFGCQS